MSMPYCRALTEVHAMTYPERESHGSSVVVNSPRMDGNTQRTGRRTHAATAHSRRQKLSSEGRRVLVCKLSQGPLRSVREPQPSAPDKSRGRENSVSVGIFHTRQPLKRVPLAMGLRERSLQYKSAYRYLDGNVFGRRDEWTDGRKRAGCIQTARVNSNEADRSEGSRRT